uniref:Uncharacterized protein n=1 Tax=Salix viminalis TaxID=40686 RepID=A0A6N2N801_SALVM
MGQPIAKCRTYASIESLTRPNQCSSFLIFFLLLSRRTTPFNLLQTFSVSELYSIPIHQHTLLTLDHPLHERPCFYCFCRDKTTSICALTTEKHKCIQR